MINQVSISSWILSLCLYYSLFPYIVVISYRFNGEILLKKPTCMHWWQFIKLSYTTTCALGTGLPYTLLIKNMDCWVEINIKLDIFLDSICCLQHTWKKGYGNDCLCFVFIFFFNYYYPPPPKKSLGPATTYSWKVLTLPKLFVKKYMSRPSLYRSIPSDKYCAVPKKILNI